MNIFLSKTIFFFFSGVPWNHQSSGAPCFVLWLGVTTMKPSSAATGCGVHAVRDTGGRDCFLLSWLFALCHSRRRAVLFVFGAGVRAGACFWCVVAFFWQHRSTV